MMTRLGAWLAETKTGLACLFIALCAAQVALMLAACWAYEQLCWTGESLMEAMRAYSEVM